MAESSAHELWRQAGGGTSSYDKARYQRLLRDHGLLLPGPPEPLPCGWPHTRRQHDPGALIEEPLELTAERGHLIETTTYDAALHPIAARIEPKPGVQFGNGHRTDCRCLACRPDILRWPPAPDLYEQGEGEGRG